MCISYFNTLRAISIEILIDKQLTSMKIKQNIQYKVM